MALTSSPNLEAFLRWWGRELLGLAPARLRDLLAPPKRRLEVTLDGDEAQLSLVEQGRVVRRDHVRLEAAARPARKMVRSFAGAAVETVLRLDRSRVLRPRLQLPMEAAGDLRAAVAAEIDRRTPFPAEAVFFDWRIVASDIDGGRLTVEAAVARRDELEAALERLAPLGLRIDRVDGPEAGGGALNLLPPERRPRPRRASRLAGPLATLAAVLLVGWSVLALEARKAEVGALEARLTALRAEHAEVAAMEERLNRLLAERNRLREKKLGSVGALALLAELTDRIPDGDWLFGLSYEDGKLRLEGFSAAASGLPSLLERSPLLEEVAFGAPVIREAGESLDRFRIEARVTARSEE